MRKFLIFCIRIYQNSISPFLGKNCRFVPTCSQYTIEAIQEYGSVRGILMGVKRIIKCNPLSEGGYDPVQKKNKREE